MMARLGAMILSLTRAEMRAYIYLIKSAPKFVSSRKLNAVILGESVPRLTSRKAEMSQSIICRIKKKLGKYHGIKNRHGFGYYFEEERKDE